VEGRSRRSRVASAQVLNLRVHFEAEAEVEYLQAFRWYERQRTGLGIEFLAEALRILAVAHDRRRPGLWNARLG